MLANRRWPLAVLFCVLIACVSGIALSTRASITEDPKLTDGLAAWGSELSCVGAQSDC